MLYWSFFWESLFVSLLILGHLWSCQVLHRRDSGFLPGERHVSGRSLQSDLVLLSGKMSEEEAELGSLPPPGPWRVEGGVREETGGREELRGDRTDGNARGDVHEVWVSVPVLPRLDRWELHQADPKIRLLSRELIRWQLGSISNLIKLKSVKMKRCRGGLGLVCLRCS